jgi:hypothetical protein
MPSMKRFLPLQRIQTAVLPFRVKTFAFLFVLLIFTGVWITLTSFRTEQPKSETGEYITMRIYENFTVTSSKIVIVYADDKSEVVELEPFKYNDDYLVRNNQVITRTLNKLRKEGYRLIVTSASGKISSNRDMMITTYILER